jgi:uncharacterized membrane protein
MDKSMNPFVPTPALPQIARVEALRPLRWIALGWQDFAANPGPSLGHAAILVAVGWLILLLCSGHIDLLAAAVSGFLLVGPAMAAGFYALSRLRAAGSPATFDASIEAVAGNGAALMRFGLLLAALALAWVLVSRLLFVEGFGGAVPPARETFYRTVFEWSDYGFLSTYMGTGALFAAVAFVISAVGAPLIFDRGTAVRTAVRTSFKAVAVNPPAMMLWALLIAGLTAIGFATFLFGLLVLLPLLGHATWHAYRDLLR